ncbi:class I SAM-dependent methyltransferase [Cetobacterium sp.]|uniref:class I SAM-dependent methyltransferase n=1 Tax=Cetobacterium sp. TaxID=2071632 RepID=UPI003F3451D8
MSVKFYNENAIQFFNSTVNADMSYIYDVFEKSLSRKGEILDLGCGSGRDSKHFLDKGYTIKAIDLSRELAAAASKYIGIEVLVSDMRTLDYSDRFIGIWASASLLHLTELEILETLKRCYKALKKNGVVYASFKIGEKNYEKDGRSFTVFTRKKFLDLIKNCDYESCETFETTDVRAEREGEKWLNVILKKK